MKQIKLNVKINKQKYPIFIGKKLCVHISKIAKFNSINFKKCLLVVDKNVPKKHVSSINKSLKNNQSCYIDYINKKQYRIKPESKKNILSIHHDTDNNLKLYSDSQMEDILNSIIEHQSGNSSTETYNSRAKLIMHNFDVFRYNAN